MAEKTASTPIKHPLWLKASEAANLAGISEKTVRRALANPDSGLVFRISKDRYQIELTSFLVFVKANIKLKNKLKDYGLGQYVKEWRELKQ